MKCARIKQDTVPIIYDSNIDRVTHVLIRMLGVEKLCTSCHESIERSWVKRRVEMDTAGCSCGCCCSQEIKLLRLMMTSTMARRTFNRCNTGVKIWRTLIIENSFENMPSYVHGRLIRTLLMIWTVQWTHSHTPKRYSWRTHLRWELSQLQP